MSMEMQRYSGNSPATQFSAHPKRRATSRQMAHSDDRTLLEAHERNNRATLTDYTNEVKNQLAQNEQHRKAQRKRLKTHYQTQHAMDVVQSIAQVRDMASMLGRGDPSKEMDFQDVADALKAGHIRGMILEDD